MTLSAAIGLRLGALDLQLDKAALKALDRAFPPPTRHAPLAML